MNEPIGLTVADIFSIVIAVCGAIVTISAALGIIVRFVNTARTPELRQNERLDALELDIKDIKNQITDDNKQQCVSAKRIDAIETEMKTSTRVIMESLQALTAHALDGNNMDQLNSSKKKLDEYLLNKV